MLCLSIQYLTKTIPSLTGINSGTPGTAVEIRWQLLLTVTCLHACGTGWRIRTLILTGTCGLHLVIYIYLVVKPCVLIRT